MLATKRATLGSARSTASTLRRAVVLPSSRSIRLSAFLPSFLFRSVKPTAPSSVSFTPARKPLSDEAFARLPLLKQYRHAMHSPVPTFAPKLNDSRFTALLFGGSPGPESHEADYTQFSAAYHPERLRLVGNRLWHDVISHVLLVLGPFDPVEPPDRPPVWRLVSELKYLASSDMALKLAAEFRFKQESDPAVFCPEEPECDVWEAYLAALELSNGRQALLEFLAPIVRREYFLHPYRRFDALPPLRTGENQPLPSDRAFDSVSPSPSPSLPFSWRKAPHRSSRHTSRADATPRQRVDKTLPTPSHSSIVPTSTPSLPPTTPSVPPTVSSTPPVPPSTAAPPSPSPTASPPDQTQDESAAIPTSWSYATRAEALDRFPSDLAASGLSNHMRYTLSVKLASKHGHKYHRWMKVARSRELAWQALASSLLSDSKFVVIKSTLHQNIVDRFPLRYIQVDVNVIASDLEQLVLAKLQNKGDLTWRMELSLPGHPVVTSEGNNVSYGQEWEKMIRRCVEKGNVKITPKPKAPCTVPSSPISPSPTLSISPSFADLLGSVPAQGSPNDSHSPERTITDKPTIRTSSTSSSSPSSSETGEVQVTETDSAAHETSDPRLSLYSTSAAKQPLSAPSPPRNSSRVAGPLADHNEASTTSEEAAASSNGQKGRKSPHETLSIAEQIKAAPDYAILPKKAAGKMPKPPQLFFDSFDEACERVFTETSRLGIPFRAYCHLNGRLSFELAGYGHSWSVMGPGARHTFLAYLVKGLVTSKVVRLNEPSATGSASTKSSALPDPSTSLTTLDNGPSPPQALPDPSHGELVPVAEEAAMVHSGMKDEEQAGAPLSTAQRLELACDYSVLPAHGREDMEKPRAQVPCFVVPLHSLTLWSHCCGCATLERAGPLVFDTRVEAQERVFLELSRLDIPFRALCLPSGLHEFTLAGHERSWISSGPAEIAVPTLVNSLAKGGVIRVVQSLLNTNSASSTGDESHSSVTELDPLVGVPDFSCRPVGGSGPRHFLVFENMTAASANLLGELTSRDIPFRCTYELLTRQYHLRFEGVNGKRGLTMEAVIRKVANTGGLALHDPADTDGVQRLKRVWAAPDYSPSVSGLLQMARPAQLVFVSHEETENRLLLELNARGIPFRARVDIPGHKGLINSLYQLCVAGGPIVDFQQPPGLGQVSAAIVQQMVKSGQIAIGRPEARSDGEISSPSTPPSPISPPASTAEDPSRSPPPSTPPTSPPANEEIRLTGTLHRAPSAPPTRSDVIHEADEKDATAATENGKRNGNGNGNGNGCGRNTERDSLK